VTGLYVALNLAFLRSAPASEMRGLVEVAHLAATHIFGAPGARLMSLVLCAALLVLDFRNAKSPMPYCYSRNKVSLAKLPRLGIAKTKNN